MLAIVGLKFEEGKGQLEEGDVEFLFIDVDYKLGMNCCTSEQALTNYEFLECLNRLITELSMTPLVQADT